MNKFNLGEKYLITTDQFFVAPDGNEYRSVWGTVKEILTDEDALGVRTNRNATNWYVKVGNMLIAGCQIHYCIRAEEVSGEPAIVSGIHDGGLVFSEDNVSRIYKADD